MKKNDISKENDVSKKRDERRTHFIESFLDAEYPSESDRTPRAIVYLIGTVEENSEVTNKLKWDCFLLIPGGKERVPPPELAFCLPAK